MNSRIDDEELEILRILDAIATQEPVREAIDLKVRAAEGRLTQDDQALLAWEPIPRSAYGDNLPPMIRSSWVFAIRARANTGAESHPNSHQRMMSYRGSGDLQIWADDEWRSNPLVSDLEASVQKRWVSVPPNVVHQAVATQETWVVLSFHTASPKELLEQRPDPDRGGAMRQYRYLDQDGRAGRR